MRFFMHAIYNNTFLMKTIKNIICPFFSLAAVKRARTLKILGRTRHVANRIYVRKVHHIYNNIVTIKLSTFRIIHVLYIDMLSSLFRN